MSFKSLLEQWNLGDIAKHIDHTVTFEDVQELSLNDCMVLPGATASSAMQLLRRIKEQLMSLEEPKPSSSCSIQDLDLDSSTETTDSQNSSVTQSCDSNAIDVTTLSANVVAVRQVSNLENELGSFIAQLYANPRFPCIVVNTIMPSFIRIFHEVLPACIDQASNETGCSQPARLRDVLIGNVKSAASNFQSEYCRLGYFKAKGTFIEPQPYVVGDSYNVVKRGNKRIRLSIKCYAQLIPLRETFCAFFSKPGILTSSIDFMKLVMQKTRSDNCTHLENFVQSPFWSGFCEEDDRIVLPYVLFISDYETGNPLSSDTSINKIGAAYISFPTLQRHLPSELNCILLALVYHSADRAMFGNALIFTPLINIINDLSENGISFDLPDFKGTVYFRLGLIVGDNLGLHSILGFSESFSSHYPCRTCKVSKTNISRIFREDAALIRQPDGYLADAEANDPASTGIKELCIWLKVKDFEMFQIGIDPAQDVLQGVGRYLLIHMLSSYVNSCKYFSLEGLNAKLESFDFGPDNDSRPIQLSMDGIRKGNLKLSASQMSTMLLYLTVLVGELVSEDDPIWSVYLKLRKIMEIIFASKVLRFLSLHLNYLITDFIESYAKVTGQNLKFKFHNLIHYGRQLELFGPIMNCLKFQEKHRPYKNAARASCNRENLTYTLANRHQMVLNNFLINENPLDSYVRHGKGSTVDRPCLLDQFNLETYGSLLKVNHVTVGCIDYKIGYTVMLSPDDIDKSSFLLIKEILVYNSSKVIFVGKVLKILDFDEHFYAFEIEKTNDTTEVLLDSLELPFPTHLTKLSTVNKYFVTLRKT